MGWSKGNIALPVPPAAYLSSHAPAFYLTLQG